MGGSALYQGIHQSARERSAGGSLRKKRRGYLGGKIRCRGTDSMFTVAPTACLNGPCIVDEEAEIRHCAFVRGSAIIGKGAVVGNSTELKNVILSNKVQVPHYNYVGDSILGYKAHMGAGSITSNVKSDKTLVVVKSAEENIETGLKKFGAMLGDCVEVGCNSVLNPGTVIGRHTNVYPLSRVRGFIPENSIFKDQEHIVLKEDRG